MSATLFWFRRDLRLTDNPALEHAVGLGNQVLPVFVVEPRRFSGAGPARRPFLLDGLASLNDDLGGNLTVVVGRVVEQLVKLSQQVGASTVVATGEASPSGRHRDELVAQQLHRHGIALECIDSPYLAIPGRLLNGSGQPYKVFTPYWRAAAAAGSEPPRGKVESAWLAPLVEFDRKALERLPLSVHEQIASLDAPSPTMLPRGGAHAASLRLEAFDQRVDHYDAERNFPALDATSRLSADLHFGTLHPRQIIDRIGSHSPGRAAFVRQIYWREFYADVAWFRPDALWNDLYPNEIATDSGPQAELRFAQWALGQTGYRLVDAGMQQLLMEGFMHNRVRMLTASFLVKDLHLPWQWGAQWFLHRLVDGDVVSNNHGWQWTAGVGTDASPYHRIFNPTLQATRFDPESTYINRYLRSAENDSEPKRETIGQDNQSSFFPERNHAPMVDHKIEREEALQRLADARKVKREAAQGEARSDGEAPTTATSKVEHP